MSTTVTINWRQLEGKLFNRFVAKLTSSQYKELMLTTNGEFEAKVNGHEFIAERSIHDVRPKKVGGELGQMVAEMDYNSPEAIEGREIREQIKAESKRLVSKLKQRLDASLGLDADLCSFLKFPKDVPLMAMPPAGFRAEDKTKINEAYLTFAKKHETETARFTEAERGVILKSMIDIVGGVGKTLDPRSVKTWEAAYMVAMIAGRISEHRTQLPKPKPTVNLEPAPLTEADQRRKYHREIIGSFRGRDITNADVDRMGSEEYKDWIRESGGKIVRSFSQLLHLPGSRQ